jgi:hypothetical protein
MQLALLALLAASLLVAPRSHAAEGAYEPNESVLSAAGPLTMGGTYAARLERQDDKDFFFFYVTSPGTPQVELTVTNLGGGSKAADLDVNILEYPATAVASQAYIRSGETRTLSIALKAQKYYVEVVGGVDFGDTYTLTPGGGAGAFGPYADIAARCTAAEAAAAAAETRLGAAEAKLQRTIARVRRARYGTPAARKSARAAYRKSRARLRSERVKAKAIAERQELWCSIPQ